MQTFNLSPSVTKFKNWFFGINPFTTLEHGNDTITLTQEMFVDKTSDLPEDGDETITYKVMANDVSYRFRDGAYYPIEPYVYGVDAKYRSHCEPIISAARLIDPSYHIPDASDSKIKSGFSITQALMFNILALQLDLEQIRNIHVSGTKFTLMDVMSRGHHPAKEENVSAWFHKEHTVLRRILASAYPSKKSFSKEVMDVLHSHGHVFTWDDVKNKAVFKMNDFIVYI